MRGRLHRRARRLASLASLAGLLTVAAGACSGDDPSPAASSATTTTTADTTTTTQGAPCPSTSQLTVTEVERVTDVKAATAFAQILDEDGNGTILLTITNAPIDRGTAFTDDDQVLAPGQALVRVRASHAGGELDLGTYRDYSSTTGDGKVVETSSVYTTDGRLLPTEEHHVDITEITPEHVCGRIVNDNDDTTYFQAAFDAVRVS